MSTRVQMRRGVKLPPNTKYVGRPSRWGNPYRVGDNDPAWCMQSIDFDTHGRIVPGKLDRRGVVYHFRMVAVAQLLRDPLWLKPLRGNDLACYCPLDDQPCHAEVLLELLAAE